jgi:hypothetical protein
MLGVLCFYPMPISFFAAATAKDNEDGPARARVLPGDDEFSLSLIS